MIKKAILIKALSEGLSAANLSILESTQLQFVEYIELLVKWNAVHNLTAIRDPLEMVKRHVLDSLVLLPYFEAFCKNRPEGRVSVLDVGTGAGLPGILLALCRPEQSFVLLDSNQKKIAFVQHVILSLKVSNVIAVCDRVEKYRPEVLFDWIVSRAFASLSDFAHLSQHLCKPDGQLVAMKGIIDQVEVEKVSSDYRIEKMASVQIPGIEAERTLVFMSITQKGDFGAK
ncbi:MAG TPA: 16S rRNA (guanine(527)-N(7))-methyltransferase RsmG [Gammaproteobacteria bacterium]|nr:16S rRNA (guanine(527)-N(7))-methyltransferase RsmG [Gammaproteobacteria bacterium]HQZ87863.1 16S rRNA (guanine(527)-N(7))-methyltransferase RsmG [Gammaproteobacteria bacterium]HRA43130.1 16S rRNA (guanine(527)-N(7))-methyltransferase RsmG [Gammaproteobacteria bacterium]